MWQNRFSFKKLHKSNKPHSLTLKPHFDLHIFIRTALKSVILHDFFIMLLCVPNHHKSTPIFLTKTKISSCHTWFANFQRLQATSYFSFLNKTLKLVEITLQEWGLYPSKVQGTFNHRVCTLVKGCCSACSECGAL